MHHADVLLAASALALSAVGLGGATSAPAAAAERTILPSPNLYDMQGTPEPLSSTQQVSLRVYLAGQHAASLTSDALAVSTPGTAGYGHYLTPAQYQRRFGPPATQVRTVTGWLTSAGMKITATTSHYIAVRASVTLADKAFDTKISQYVTTVSDKGCTTTIVTGVGTVGTLSVPAAVGADIATVTGLAQTATSSDSAEGSPAPSSVHVASSRGSGYQCSQYWGQHVEKIPAAYGRTTAPTQLCGYTPAQMRKAYGVADSPYTGRGVTVAIVLNEAWPTMLDDANRFFASQGVAGFAPGQYTESFDSRFASTCGVIQNEPGIQPDPEEDGRPEHVMKRPAMWFTGRRRDREPMSLSLLG